MISRPAVVSTSLPVVFGVLLASGAGAVNLPGTLNTGSTYNGSYDVPNIFTTSTAGGPGIVNFGGFVDSSGAGDRLSWLVNTEHKIQYASSAQIQNNTSGLINARPMEWVGVGVDAPEDHVVEFDAGFNADMGTQAAQVGGMSTIYFYNTTLITHATQNLPSVWKQTTDKTGVLHDTHHGLLQFYSPYYYSNDKSRSTIWQVRSNDQTSDAGVYWKADLTIDVAAGLTFSSNTYWEQSVVGPHVGFGTQRAEANTTLTKTGAGKIVIARAGIQGYGSNTTLDIQDGWIEFNSDATQQEANYYLQNTSSSATVKLEVAAGGGVAFHAYTWPDNTNWWSGSGGTHGVDNRHQVASVNASGTVRVGGLWSPTADSWDQYYQTQMDSLAPETATEGDAFVQVSGSFTLASSALLDVTLGSVTPAAGKIDVGGSASLDGVLALTLESGYDPSLGTDLLLIDSSARSGIFDQVQGVLFAAGKALAVTYDGNQVWVTVAKPGDMNLDGVVDQDDLNDLAANWKAGGQNWAGGDINGDGVVNEYDLSSMASNWDPNASVTFAEAATALGLIPEPGSLALLGLGGLALIARRKRVA